MDEVALLQLARDEADPAGLVHVGRDEAPAGLRLATIGVRAATRSKSSSVKSMPSSRAIAIRCSTPFVEPPVAATQAAAFSSAERVISCEGRRSRRTTSIDEAARGDRRVGLALVRGRDAGERRRADAQEVERCRHRVGGELAPARAGARQAADSSSCSSAPVMLPPR